MDQPNDKDIKLVDNLDDNRLKTLISDFQKKRTENSKLRAKYANEPRKFASSETELFAALDKLQNVTTQPELYHILAEKKVPEALVSLIEHENSDISAKVITIIQELLDEDNNQGEESFDLFEIFCSHKVDLSMNLVINLKRLNENDKDEAAIMIESMGILENITNLTSYGGHLYVHVFIEWAIKKLNKSPKYNAIKLAMMELLNIYNFDGENSDEFYKKGGIEALLKQVAYYRLNKPTSVDEAEFQEQTLHCLCTCLLEDEECYGVKEKFFKEEGVELIELILREKNEAVKKTNIKYWMIKLLNHAITTSENHDPIVTKICERFISILGLKVLFPIFNQPKIILTGKRGKRSNLSSIDEIEEHTSSIILALLKHCQDAQLIQRVLVKFSENNFEKLNRLISLHDKYFEKYSKCESENHPDPDQSDKAHYILRIVDYVIFLVCYLSNQYETYDPTSGEKFNCKMTKILGERPELKVQLLENGRKHLKEVKSSQETNSLGLLLAHFEKL